MHCLHGPHFTLSLAGTSIQFVDFSGKIVQHGHRLHNSTGGLEVNDKHEIIIIEADCKTSELDLGLLNTCRIAPRSIEEFPSSFAEICARAYKIH
jgi:hypothetical protein